MPRPLVQNFVWGGLNTRASTTGLPLLNSVVLQDMRVVGTELVKRLGMVRICQLSHNWKSTDLDSASSEYWTTSATADSRVWALGTQFTIEVLVQPETTTGTQNIIGFNHATNFPVRLYIDGGQWRAYAQDSAGNSTDFSHTTPAPSAGVTTLLTLTRSGDAFTLYADGTQVNASNMPNAALRNLKTPGGALEIGRHNTANHFNGKVDFLRVYSYVKTHSRDRLIRAPNPRSAYVLADYDFNESAANLAYDRSRYENHLIATNTPTEATPLAHNPAFVRVLSLSVDENNRRQLLMVSGGNYYLATVD